jgi:hypothetical protein
LYPDRCRCASTNSAAGPGRGGAAVVVRTAPPDDAAAIRDLLRDVDAITEFIVTLAFVADSV